MTFKPLFRHGDDVSLRRKLGLLRKLNLDPGRPSQHQVKIGRYNWYPSTGVIVVDGQGRHHRQGFTAFLDLVQPEAPKIGPLERETVRTPTTHTGQMPWDDLLPEGVDPPDTSTVPWEDLLPEGVDPPDK